MTDPIADMLTRMRNGLKARHQRVDIPASRIKMEIARILREEGYIFNYKLLGEGAHKVLRVYLKYGPKGEAVISQLERVSKPGRRYYVSAQEIPRVRGGLGISILSTSQGVMTGREARRRNIGGEVLCSVY
ncbi:MAG: 30S ribosomal protein S8 [Acidobacteriota bacterium]|nr:30S ribosomal protein S8 [Blastocatellia bacterium]MDW8241017.1 30S ribosomal protein S8 [Acidobacteriota bacterium]